MNRASDERKQLQIKYREKDKEIKSTQETTNGNILKNTMGKEEAARSHDTRVNITRKLTAIKYHSTTKLRGAKFMGLREIYG